MSARYQHYSTRRWQSPPHRLSPFWQKFRISNCPAGLKLADIYRCFDRHDGRIVHIGVDERKPGIAFITFSPPPQAAFLHKPHVVRVNGKEHRLKLYALDNTTSVQSPLDKSRQMPVRIVLQPIALSVGVQTGPSEMTIHRNVMRHTSNAMTIETNIKSDSQELVAEFAAVVNATTQAHQLRIGFGYISQVHYVLGANKTTYLILNFQYPPKFMALAHGQHLPTPEDYPYWNRDNAFHRVTDLDWDMRKRADTVVSLTRRGAFIDPGRWLTWRFSFDSEADRGLPLLLEALSAFNIPISTDSDFCFLEENRDNDAIPWSIFNADSSPSRAKTQRSSALQDLQAHSYPQLGFEIRYQLDVILSKGLMYEGDITKDFLNRLSQEPRAEDLLANFVAADRKLHQPIELFNVHELRTRRKKRLPKTCVLMHSVTVTPTTIYVHPVQVEVSNRVIRKYNELSDRFLRVRFMDEQYYGKLQPQTYQKTAEVFNRVRRTLFKGLRIGGRYFHFLACGNSQFREHGAYFFAPTEDVSINSIRQWMGYFQAIREIPKYVSRVGQCFSTTRAITSIGRQPEIVEIADVIRNGYTFTDGVGKISPFLAHMIATELHFGPEAPSAYQFRMGGCKGILAVDASLQKKSVRQVHIRPSQMKFKSDFNQLEIIRVSSFASAYLNKQIILVLSALGIPDEVFVRKLKQQLVEINLTLEDDERAISMLMQTVDYNQVTVDIAKMIQGGLRQEPFVDSMLHLWRAWVIKFLKEKTNLYVSQGAFVLGCVDETATLLMEKDKLPEIFLQVPEQNYSSASFQHTLGGGKRGSGGVKNGAYRVIEGTCILLRNPCLHPGDIRIVRAVDCQKLRHLRDVVVLPILGERDLANMCSGGDLDGDDFMVIWDPELIPDKVYEPMDYTAPKPKLSQGPVTQSDMMDFFCDFMKNDSLGSIAVAHRAWADRLPEGVMAKKCLELANLHSQAVDYCKTGYPAQMNSTLRVEKYPHWAQKPSSRSYHSQDILGQLFDEVERVEFKVDPVAYHEKFDSRILEAFDLSKDLLDKVREIKDEFDQDFCRIMAQYGVKTEFEVRSSFVMSHNREIKDYKFAEEMGSLMNTLKRYYRDLCFEAVGLQGSFPDMDKLGQLVAALYKVTADECKQYAARERAESPQTDPRNKIWQRTPNPIWKQTPLISFPWIFLDELVGLAQMLRSPDKPSLAAVMAVNKVGLRQLRSQGVSRFDRVSTHHVHNGKTTVALKTDVGNQSSGSSVMSSGSNPDVPRSRPDSAHSSATSSGSMPETTKPGLGSVGLKDSVVDDSMDAVTSEHVEGREESGEESDGVFEMQMSSISKLMSMLGV